MRALRTLRPGAAGTMRQLGEYGDRLVCVRYRYDEQSKKRYTTVELIVGEAPWQPPGEKIVRVRVNWGERELAIRIRKAGGKWDKQHKLWELPMRLVREFGLENRIMTQPDVQT